MITIALAGPQNIFLDGLNVKLLDILKQHPDTPFSISMLAEMLGTTTSQIETAIEELEGPIDSEIPGAFVHFWRFTREAIFTP